MPQISRLPMRHGAALGLALCLLWGAPLAAQDEGWDRMGQEELRTAAEAGSAAAQTELGLRYSDGDGVLQSFLLAASWFARAAEQGDPLAQNRLARYYYEGLGVERDEDLALRLFAQAAQTGEADYLFDLGSALESASTPQPGRAAEYYWRASELGNMDAAVSLAYLFQNGTGVAQDLERAISLYEAPAEAGHPRALNNLGLLYARGEGVEQDYERAAGLFAAAAESGLGEALTNLGVMYENAFGVPLDEERAAELYRMGGQSGVAGLDAGETAPLYDARLAPPDETEDGLRLMRQGAGAGDPLAAFQLAFLLLGQAPDERAATDAASLLRQAAEAGLASAMANLGLLYFQGRGVPQDYALGHMWLALAGTAGFPGANALNAQLSLRMPVEQINEAQRLAMDRRSARLAP